MRPRRAHLRAQFSFICAFSSRSFWLLSYSRQLGAGCPMTRTHLILGHIEGKLDVFNIECTMCAIAYLIF